MKNQTYHMFLSANRQRNAQVAKSAVIITDANGNAVAKAVTVLPLHVPGENDRPATCEALWIGRALAEAVLGNDQKIMLHADRASTAKAAQRLIPEGSQDDPRLLIPDGTEPWWTDAFDDAYGRTKAVRRGAMFGMTGTDAVLTMAVSDDKDLDVGNVAVLLSDTHGAEMGYAAASFRGSSCSVKTAMNLGTMLAAILNAKSVAVEAKPEILYAADEAAKSHGVVHISVQPVSGGIWAMKSDDMQDAADSLSDGYRNAIA